MTNDTIIKIVVIVNAAPDDKRRVFEPITKIHRQEQSWEETANNNTNREILQNYMFTNISRNSFKVGLHNLPYLFKTEGRLCCNI